MDRCCRIVCAKAGISTPDWRPLVVALPSAVYSRTGISVRPFVPWPTSILFNAPRTNLSFSFFGEERERKRMHLLLSRLPEKSARAYVRGEVKFDRGVESVPLFGSVGVGYLNLTNDRKLKFKWKVI